MISNPILHDIIKSELTHNANIVLGICRNVPCLKESKLLVGNYWTFKESRQEVVNQRYRQSDCVWFFDGKEKDNYYIIHEIKTGHYSVTDACRKYYSGQNSQVWIWGWNQNKVKKSIEQKHKRRIKLIDIEYIAPLVSKDIKTICSGLVS